MLSLDFSAYGFHGVPNSERTPVVERGVYDGTKYPSWREETTKDKSAPYVPMRGSKFSMRGGVAYGGERKKFSFSYDVCERWLRMFEEKLSPRPGQAFVVREIPNSLRGWSAWDSWGRGRYRYSYLLSRALTDIMSEKENLVGPSCMALRSHIECFIEFKQPRIYELCSISDGERILIFENDKADYVFNALSDQIALWADYSATN